MKRVNASLKPSRARTCNPGTNLKPSGVKPKRHVTVMKVADALAAKQKRKMTEQTDHWETSQKILVILAHPDDPEFFCGGTLARWARAGHEISYVLLTCGDKGFNPATQSDMTPEKLCGLRYDEQQNAAKVIGASSVRFLNRADGYLTPDLDLRRDVV